MYFFQLRRQLKGHNVACSREEMDVPTRDGGSFRMIYFVLYRVDTGERAPTIWTRKNDIVSGPEVEHIRRRLRLHEGAI